MNISEVPLGSIIRFGAYAVRSEVPHAVDWYKVNRDNTLISKTSEDYLSYDAKESHAGCGNNDYGTSNIDQFLNKSDEDWYIPVHVNDRPPSASNCRRSSHYHDHPGFLAFFKEWEINLIKTSEIKYRNCRVPENSDKFTTIKRKIYLPSIANFNTEFDGIFGGGTEDTLFEWIPPGSGVSESCLFHTTVEESLGRDVARFMTRSIHIDSRSYIYCYSPNMGFQARHAYNESAVRPVLRLSDNSTVEETTINGETVYIVVQSMTATPPREELTALLVQ